MRTINVEPNWSRMFDNAIVQVKAVVDKNDMQAFIVEMLEFGKRLYNQQSPFVPNTDLDSSRVDAVSVGAINKEFREGMEKIRNGTEME